MLFGLLDEIHRSAAVTGDLFEIGVHQGKSAVLLCAMARGSETVGVCDLFDEQGLNVSRSGAGDRALLERNIEAINPGFQRLAVYAKPSASLIAAEIGSPKRLFHVDGGHLAEEALADMRLAADVLDQRGALVVDDPFRPEWPGVTEAILRFCGERRDDYAPLILGFNKLVLTLREARPHYEAALSRDDLVWSYFDRRVYESKTLPVAGDPVRIFMIPTYRQVPALGDAVARARFAVSRAKRVLGRARHAVAPRGA